MGMTTEVAIPYGRHCGGFGGPQARPTGVRGQRPPHDRRDDAYTDDLAGNRTGVWENGVATQAYSYNAANQVIGWSYDAAGNLLSDGTTSSTWDALNRTLTHAGASYAYNGDGILTAQTIGGVTTRYAQDLAVPLPVILSDGTAHYVYGHERLFGDAGSDRTWYLGDALGSVRATLDSTGTPLASARYDPWGTPVTAAIAPFGFTGELQQGNEVYLRARWYNSAQGAFPGWRWETGESYPDIPSSNHPYHYAFSNPITYTDASGRDPLQPGGDDSYQQCLASLATNPAAFPCTPPGVQPPAPLTPAVPRLRPTGIYPDLEICAVASSLPPAPLPGNSPIAPIDIGFVVGIGGSAGTGPGGTVGIEIVYDLYDFEVDGFVYGGLGATWGASITGYVGSVTGWRHFREEFGVENYTGPFVSFGAGYSVLSGQVFFGQPSATGERMIGGLLGVGPAAKIEFRGIKLPDIPGNPSLTVPVYKTFGEIAQVFGLGSGTSKLTFHRAGTRTGITQADGSAFAAFLERTAGGNSPLTRLMQSIVRHNAAAWDAQP